MNLLNFAEQNVYNQQPVPQTPSILYQSAAFVGN